MVRQGRSIAVVWTFLIGCAVLLVVGCSGTSSETSNKKEQEPTEATKKEQTRSPNARASEEARCDGTRSFHRKGYLGLYVTNDVPGCPKGGLLKGTDKSDNLSGKDGDDEIRGLDDQDYLHGGGGNDLLVGGPDRREGNHKGIDVLYGGVGSDVLHGGAGTDSLYAGNQQTVGCCGKDVIYGEDGNDLILADDGDRQDKLYCGEGFDQYMADKGDFVSSSCEKKWNGIVS